MTPDISAAQLMARKSVLPSIERDGRSIAYDMSEARNNGGTARLNFVRKMPSMAE